MISISLVETIKFFIVCGLVCSGAFMLQKRIDPSAGAPDSFIESLLIASGWIVVSTEIFGALHLVSFVNLTLIDTGFFCTAVYLHLTRPHYKATGAPLNACPPMLIPAFLITVAVAIAGLTWAVVSPPPPWDAFVYHLSFPASWVKAGSIFPVTVPFGDQAGTYFPANAELIYLRILVSLKQDFATNALQFVFLIGCAVAVYRLAVTCGARVPEAVSAAAGIFFMPIMFHQAAASEVDIIFAFFFISALYFTFRWEESPNRPKTFFTFLSIGLLAGTKTISLLFIAIIILPICLFFFIRKKAWGALIWGVIVAILTGSFWYIRNWILTGNPIFPLSVSVAGFEVFHGAYTRWTMLQSVFHTNNPAEWLRALADGWGLCFAVACGIAVPAALAWPNRNFKIKLVAASALAVAAICCFVIPYNREVRFAFGAFLLACVCVAWIASQPKKTSAMLVCSFPVFFILNIAAAAQSPDGSFYMQLATHLKNIVSTPDRIYTLIAPGAWILLVAGCCTALVAFIILCKARYFWGSRLALAVCGALLIAGFFVTSVNYPKYQYAYYASFPIGRSWAALHKISPPPSRIAYTGTDLNFGLYGQHLKNQILYIPITKWDANSFHECLAEIKKTGRYKIPDTDRIDFCRREPDYVTWYERLFNTHSGLLYVTVLHQNDLTHIKHDPEGFPIERTWADLHPDRFTLVYSNPQVRIYTIK